MSYNLGKYNSKLRNKNGQLVLTGEIEAYVNGIQMHGLED